eukprot:GHVS01055823.1.p1 GENE.GHVS01055823.1~~GHVS01055823.1.p1  ORF type:complete len:181 (-),score=32.67 GHVS01055823.1:21-509(-)
MLSFFHRLTGRLFPSTQPSEDHSNASTTTLPHPPLSVSNFQNLLAPPPPPFTQTLPRISSPGHNHSPVFHTSSSPNTCSASSSPVADSTPFSLHRLYSPFLQVLSRLFLLFPNVSVAPSLPPTPPPSPTSRLWEVILSLLIAPTVGLCYFYCSRLRSFVSLW